MGSLEKPSDTVENKSCCQESRQLPVCLVAVMWLLGLIEWSEPDRHTSCRDGRPSLTAVRDKTKRRVLCLTSRVSLTTLVGVNIYCGFTYVARFFGVAHNFYHFASYLITYWPLMISVQLICLLTTLCRWVHNSDYTPIDGQWWTVLSESSIARRFHDFQFRGYLPPKVGYLIVFSLFAVLNNALVITNFYLNDKSSIHEGDYVTVKHLVELMLTVSSMCYYAAFCYFLYLQRIALEIHCSKLVWYLKRNAGAFEECQIKLNECFKEYMSLRRLVHPWITMVVSATTFGLAVHVAWNYKAIGASTNEGPWSTIAPIESNLTDVNATSSKSFNFYFLDSLIFINKLSVLLMALLAVGGTDVNSIWKRCVFTINILRSSAHERFWSKIIKLIRELNKGTTADAVIDILLPVLLLALGILGVDKFDF